MRGELHIHTTASDGELRLEEILKYVSGKEDYISITDHDILGNSIKAKEIAPNYGLKAIVGVEISTKRNDENVHILGYFNDESDLKELEEVLLGVRKHRVVRLYLIKAKLKEVFDIDLDITNLLKLASVTRGSIGREIIKQGYNYSTKEIFDQMIGVGCPAYIPSSKISTQEGIDLVHRAHGKAVLAHPTLLKDNDPEDIVKMGVDGIEAIYPLNKDGEEEKFRSLAKKYNLFITGGSDFHAFNDNRHGDLLTTLIEGEDLDRFLKEVL